MTDVTKNLQQMTEAREFVEMVALSGIKGMQESHHFIRAISRADLDGDGVVSGQELAAMTVKTPNMFNGTDPREISRLACVGENPNLVAGSFGIAEKVKEAVDTLNSVARRRLHALNNPEDPSHGQLEVSTLWQMNFAESMNLSVMHLTPEVRDYVDAAAKDLVRIFNENLVKVSKELVDNREIGALPKQVLPVNGTDICVAAKTI